MVHLVRSANTVAIWSLLGAGRSSTLSGLMPRCVGSRAEEIRMSARRGGRDERAHAVAVQREAVHVHIT